MSQVYQPLHHKYRPERFDDLVGQEPIAATLKQALITSRIAPAYLFSGPRGTGKTSSARILARSLNCLKSNKPTDQPCGECESCKAISIGSSLDVIEIDAASNTGVDNIRELIERSRFAPVQARWKVYVIDECHMLSTAAFNALLKTLEEPPPQVVFVLATTDPQRVLSTILSRCQCFEFRRIPLGALNKHLQMIASLEAIAIEPEALNLIAQRAQGGLRDAESMLDQLSLLPQPIKIDSVWDLIGAVPEQKLLILATALANSNPIQLLETCRNLLDHGKDPIPILQGLTSILRDLVLLSAAPSRPELTSVSMELHKQLGQLASELELKKLLQWQAQLKGAEMQLRHSVQPRLWLEVLLLGLLACNVNHNRKSDPDYLHHTKKTKPLPSVEEDCLQRTKAIVNSEDPITKQQIIQENNSNKSLANTQNDEKKDLAELWQQILGRLELPSTRMLLSQQAKLIRLTPKKAYIQVSANWMGMVQSRLGLLEEAINKTLGSTRTLELENKVEQSSRIKSKEPEIKPTIETKNIELESNSVSNDYQKSISDSSPSTIENAETNTTSIKQEDIRPPDQSNHEIDNQAKNLADFFNGKVLDIEI